jgi:internalin A
MRRFLIANALSLVVAVAVADETRNVLEALARITVPTVDLNEPAKLRDLIVIRSPTEEDLSIVANLPALEQVNFASIQLPEAGLSQLKNAPRLRTLSFSGGRLGAKHLQEIGAVEQLEGLSFDHVELDQDGLRSLKKLKNLKKLRIFPFDESSLLGVAKAEMIHLTWYCQHDGGIQPTRPGDVRRLYCDDSFSDEALAACKYLTGLRSVELPRHATDKTMRCLAAWPELQSLRVNSSQVTDVSLPLIIQSAEITFLDLKGTAVTLPGMITLKKLKRLRTLRPPYMSQAALVALRDAKLLPAVIQTEKDGRCLHLGGDVLNDETLALIGEMTELEKLHLVGSGVTDNGLKQLASLKGLKELHLGEAKGIRGSGLAALGEMPELRILCVYYSTLDDSAAEGLAKLTSLRELEIQATNVTAAIVPKLEPLKNLTHLRLPKKAVNDANINWLVEHGQLHTLHQCWHEMRPAADDAHIQSVDLRNTAATEKLLPLFRTIPVKTLHGPSELTDEGLAVIGTMTELECLFLPSQSKITDDGVKHLASLKNLQRLDLEDSSISDRGIRHLHGLTQLIDLRLGQTKIGDETLRWAETLPGIKFFSADGTQLSLEAKRRFAKARPDCLFAVGFFPRER